MTPLINGVVLSLLNLVSILAGSVICYFVGDQNKVAVQLISACALNTLMYIIWGVLSRKSTLKKKVSAGRKFLTTLGSSLISGVSVFIFIQYMTQKTVGPVENILAILMFQIPTNLLILKIYNNIEQVLNLRDSVSAKEDEYQKV